MRLALLTLWESNIYWNGDNIGSQTGANRVVLPSSSALTLIGESANKTTLPNSVGLIVIGEPTNAVKVDPSFDNSSPPPPANTRYILLLALTTD